MNLEDAKTNGDLLSAAGYAEHLVAYEKMNTMKVDLLKLVLLAMNHPSPETMAYFLIGYSLGKENAGATSSDSPDPQRPRSE